jgi:DNA-binding transcriptional LysR family regulator
VIQKFRELYPHIKIEVQRGVASRIPKEITAREVELGVISFKPTDESLRSVAVVTDELALIVAPDHPLAGKGTVSIGDLGDETFIAHNALSPYRQKVFESFDKHNTKLNISIELPSLEAIKRLVEKGVGVALVPKLTAQAEIDKGQLKALSVKEMKLERKLNIVYRRKSVLSHAAQMFLKVAKEMGGK